MAPLKLKVVPTLDEQARERIKEWLQAWGYTQTELCARIGKNQAWMTRYLRGKFNADLETLQKIARAFGHPGINALFDLPELDDAERRLLEDVRALPVTGRSLVAQMAAQLAHPNRRTHSRK